MLRVRTLHALHSSLVSKLTIAVDLSDILRAEIVMAVSAFDFFIHELSRLGMLESFSGKRPRTDAFNKWQMPITAIAGMADIATANQVLDYEIRSRHRFLSFQQPDKIADAVRLFSDVKLWDEIATKCNEDKKATKESFKLIIDRRNQIAHEADLNPSYPGELWPIDVLMVESIFDRIEAVARAIFECVHPELAQGFSST